MDTPTPNDPFDSTKDDIAQRPTPDVRLRETQPLDTRGAFAHWLGVASLGILGGEAVLVVASLVVAVVVVVVLLTGVFLLAPFVFICCPAFFVALGLLGMVWGWGVQLATFLGWIIIITSAVGGSLALLGLCFSLRHPGAAASNGIALVAHITLVLTCWLAGG